jgi:hypothetical protein
MAEETLKAKKAFEIHTESFGVRIKQYQADNGRFQDVTFKEHCIEQGQRLTYCGVNALPKRKGRKKDKRFTGRSKNIIVTCNKEMAFSDNDKFMAICTPIHK